MSHLNAVSFSVSEICIITIEKGRGGGWGNFYASLIELK